MRACDIEIVAVDFETTGSVPGHPDEPWQVGMVVVRGGRVDPARTFESLLRVAADRPFNPRAPGRHHQLRAELACAPRMADLWPELRQWWTGRPLAAHNAATERKIVSKAAPLHRAGPWVDTLKLVRSAYPDLESHTLERVTARLGLGGRLESLCPGRAPRDALYDACGSAVLLEHLLALPGWGELSVERLAGAHPRRFYNTRRPKD